MATWQDQLKMFASDPRAAQQEILRAKSVYEQKMKAGDKAGAEAAHRWADQVRAASGISNSDSMYGNDPRTYQGGSKGPSVPSPFQPPTPIQPPNLGGAGVGIAPDLMQAIFGMLGNGGSVPDSAIADIKKSAQQRADMERQAFERQLQMLQAQQQASLGNIAYGQQQLNAQRMQNMNNFMLNMYTMNSQRSQEQAALEAMMAQYGIGRDTGLSQIQNSTEDAKQALENKSFQDYLQSRQSIADRGLSGSGIAADADTRLALAKQQNMAGIMRDAATRKSDIEAKYAANMDKAKADTLALQSRYGGNLMKLLSDMSSNNMNLSNQAFKLLQDRGNILSQYAPQFGSVYDKMNNISAAQYEQDAISKAQQAADKSANDRLQILSTLLGKMMPYDAMTLNQMGQLGLNYDKLNSGNLNEYYDRLINQSQFDQMMDWRYKQLEQNGMIDWSKLAGVLPDGTPTMDARKLQQQQAYQAQLLQLRQMGLENTQMYRDLSLQLQLMRFNETQMNNDRQVIQSAMSAVDREMATLSSRLATEPNNNEIRQRLNDLTKQKMYLMSLYTSGQADQVGSSAPPLGYADTDTGRWAVQGPPLPK